MDTVTFFIRSNKKDEVKVWLRLRNGVRTDIQVTTGISLPTKYWDKGQIKKRVKIGNEIEKNRLNEVEIRLNNIRNTLFTLIDTTDVVTPFLVREVIGNYRSSLKSRVNKVPSDILKYIDYRIEGMKKGIIVHKGQKYDLNTIRMYSSFKKLINRFIISINTQLTWEDIDKDTIQRFVLFLQANEYLTKSINKFIVIFRALANSALHEDHLYNDYSLPKRFYKIKETEESKTKSIYLTSNELQALFKMELIGIEDRVRDVFLIGCFTGRKRVSDYTHLTTNNFSATASGTKVVRLIQEKTKNKVTIPILDSNLLKIAEKYDYKFPKISDILLNKHIKIICEKLSVTIPSLAKLERTILTMKEKKAEKSGKTKFIHVDGEFVLRHRYELVCTHTARRSCITNMYLSGIFDDHQLRSISGHKSQQAFEGYLCMSGDEIADKIAYRIKEWGNI